MKIVETQMTLIALTLDEVELIKESLQLAYYQCDDEEAGALLSQFNKATQHSECIRNQVLND